MSKISIIDYGMGNLFSIGSLCDYVGMDYIITSDREKIAKSDAIILPGVGAFGEAMENIRKLNIDDFITDIIKSGKPTMAICLGMQLLMSNSEEFGSYRGLDIVSGNVIKFKQGKCKVPQIGWNKINKKNREWNNTPLQGLGSEYMYFVHSYYVCPTDKNIILSTSEYQETNYCSSFLYHNVFACQFHPERSGEKGIEIYKNFKIWVEKRKENNDNS